jgi:hypothetical protein
MKDLSDYLLRYEYTFVFDLEGMPSLELSYGSKDIELISGESLEMPWHEVVKSKIVNIEIIDDIINLKLIIPCKPLWESTSEKLYVKENEVSEFYYGRTTNTTATDYYFKFYIIKKNQVVNN